MFLKDLYERLKKYNAMSRNVNKYCILQAFLYKTSEKTKMRTLCNVLELRCCY